MIDQLIALLQDKDLLLSDRAVAQGSEALPLLQAEDLADMLWLADKFGGAYVEDPVDRSSDPDAEGQGQSQLPVLSGAASAESLPAAEMFVPPVEGKKKTDKEEEAPVKGVPIQVEAAPALPNRRKLAGSLRPLMRKVPSRKNSVLDATATVNSYAERRIWMPVLKPARERWFDLELVIEASQFSFVWEETLDEFQQMLAWQGAFRQVRTWVVEASETGEPRLLGKRAYDQASLRRSVAENAGLASRSAKELVDASGRRLVMYVSDCRSEMWQSGQIHAWLQLWSRSGPTAVVQLLPGRLWAESELDVGLRSQVSAFTPGVTNDKLRVHLYAKQASAKSSRQTQSPQDSLTLPIVTLTPAAMLQWAKVVTAAGRQRSPARLFDMAWVKDPDRIPQPGVVRPGSAQARVELFRATASAEAQRLAGMMAAVPVDMAVVNMIRQELLPEVAPVHVAEVFDSGLLKRVQEASELPEYYEFETDVRGLLNVETPLDDTFEVIEALSQRIARKLGFTIKSFTALLSPKSYWQEGNKAEILPFAQVTTGVLRKLGGEYAELAAVVEADAKAESGWIVPQGQREEADDDFPALETFEFNAVQFREASDLPPLSTESFTFFTLEWQEPEPDPTRQQPLEPFDITVATLVKAGRRWQVQREQAQAHRFTERLSEERLSEDGLASEDISEDITLEMVAIPGGSFMMGSPAAEPERYGDEGPQHEVTIEPFFMGRYPVTQAQWRAVAAMPQIERELASNPSSFKGDDRLPVEKVSWYDAEEFCARLSAHTGREYQLPTEAQWEYACRAGTTTAFHFGDMITTEVANYDGSAYAKGPKGKAQNKMTPVDHFGFSNAYGLSDMHGNVDEWCQDHWHEDYADAPADGSVWLTDDEEADRVRRGGSWSSDPRYCRSAYRSYLSPGTRYYFFGFRVSCVAPRTLQ